MRYWADIFVFCFWVFTHLPARVFCLFFQTLIFLWYVQGTIWENCPFGTETLLFVERCEWMDAPLPTSYQWQKKKLLEAQCFFFPKSPSSLILLDFWRCLVLQRPWIGSIGKWVLANPEQWRSMLLEGACQAHPPHSEHLVLDYFIIPGLYNFQPACQCVTILYRAFWVRVGWRRQRANDTSSSFTGKEPDCWEYFFFFSILVTVLLRDCRHSLAFIFASRYPTNSAEWRRILFFLLATFPLKGLEF